MHPARLEFENYTHDYETDNGLQVAECRNIKNPQGDGTSLIRAVYKKKQIEIKDDSFGLYKYMDWLPVRRILEGSAAPVTYKSERLASFLGLKNLYITFSGYWPEKKAMMTSCSFKETEAYSVCGRLDRPNERILVVASAGNTARAFAKVCSENRIPVLISIPEDNMDAMWFEKPLNDCVKIISTPSGSDYFDAIYLANIVCSSDKFLEEGGAKNVARRDGMGTTVLSAVMEIGEIPDYYFQAVGSGTGTIAAWETNLRLIEDGRFGNKTMRLVPAQNYPFVPMYDAWNNHSREIHFEDEALARNMALQIEAKVLANRKPPYGIKGGLFDALTATGGTMKAVTNEDLNESCRLFEQLEGIDVNKAAGVAISALRQSAENKEIGCNDIIMLNITGGGEKLFKNHNKTYNAKPDFIVDVHSMPKEKIISEAEALFR